MIDSPNYVDNEGSIDKINKILHQRIDIDKKSVGIAVGVVSGKGHRVIGYGKLSHEIDQVPDSETVFGMGSITKTFTATLLADMVIRGEVQIEDPISKFLPSSVKVPIRNGKEITLLDLATHTSGLPKFPDNLSPSNPINPFADYGVEKLYSFVSNYTLTGDIGTEYVYSNVGYGLLGHLLSKIAGMEYEDLLTSFICEPLEMKRTKIRRSAEIQKNMAVGHDGSLQATPNQDSLVMEGAGAIYSTAEDMLRFIGANLGIQQTQLTPTMQKMHHPLKTAGQVERQIGLGWHVLNKYGSEIVLHNGFGGGYHAFCGFDRSKNFGVVVLSNSNNNADDIGLHLLNSNYELIEYKQKAKRVPITLKPDIYDNYVGEYEFSELSMSIEILVEGDSLFVDLGDQGKSEILSETENRFFLKEAEDIEITFALDEQGTVTHLTAYQDGHPLEGKRINNIDE
jgi:CubicO group peptidase (beta-lactamase class C family)